MKRVIGGVVLLLVHMVSLACLMLGHFPILDPYRPDPMFPMIWFVFAGLGMALIWFGWQGTEEKEET